MPSMRKKMGKKRKHIGKSKQELGAIETRHLKV